MLPPELTAPPPRDPSAAPALFARNRSLVRSLWIGAFVVPALVPVLFLFKFGEIDLVWVAASSGGLFVLVAAMAFAMGVNLKRAMALFRDGRATEGKVSRIQASGDRQGNAYVRMDVEFADGSGLRFSGPVMTLGNVRDVDRKAGDEVAILHLEQEPERFAVYTPGLGLAIGRAKRMTG